MASEKITREQIFESTFFLLLLPSLVSINFSSLNLTGRTKLAEKKKT